MKHHHTVVWIDHREAHILSFGMDPYASEHDRTVVHSGSGTQKLHHRSDGTSSGHAPEDSRYYTAVAEALKDAGEILLTGPADAKHHLGQLIERAYPRLASRIAGIEPMDRLSEGELVAHARKSFRRLDRMRPAQTGA